MPTIWGGFQRSWASARAHRRLLGRSDRRGGAGTAPQDPAVTLAQACKLIKHGSAQCKPSMKEARRPTRPSLEGDVA